MSKNDEVLSTLDPFEFWRNYPRYHPCVRIKCICKMGNSGRVLHCWHLIAAVYKSTREIKLTMCFLVCTLLVSLWCYDDLCLAIKFNVPPDIYTVICCCSVIVDVAAADIKNYSNIYFFLKEFCFFLSCFLFLFISCLCQPHECDCIQYFSIKVSGKINLHCHWAFTTLYNTASLKW